MRITGDPGAQFSGDIGTSEGSRTVEGIVPQDFPVEVDRDALAFDPVVATAQNLGGSGTLTVPILEGDEVRKKSTTTAQYGVATIDWVPGEQ